MVLTEHDVITSWLNNNDVGKAVFDDPNPINIYNEWCNKYDIDAHIQVVEENTNDDYVQQCTSVENWHMPDEYKNLNIPDYLYEKVCVQLQMAPCDFVSNSSKWIRVEEELTEFNMRGMEPVLKFLIYLVNICKENDIVLGVGRGSSVASYILYLIGIHKVDSIKYDLDIKEFLK